MSESDLLTPWNVIQGPSFAVDVSKRTPPGKRFALVSWNLGFNSNLIWPKDFVSSFHSPLHSFPGCRHQDEGLLAMQSALKTSLSFSFSGDPKGFGHLSWSFFSSQILNSPWWSMIWGLMVHDGPWCYIFSDSIIVKACLVVIRSHAAVAHWTGAQKYRQALSFNTILEMTPHPS